MSDMDGQPPNQLDQRWLNPCRTVLISGNMEIYMYFLSILDTGMVAGTLNIWK